MKQTAIWLYRLFAPVCDPLHSVRGLLLYPRFIRELWKYRRLQGTEHARFGDLYPTLHDRTSKTSIDAHYFYTNGWAMRRIVEQRPPKHMDIGSQTMFVNLLSAVLPVTFIDYRPLEARMMGLTSRGGDILNLPLDNGSVESLSCLHVAEHIGLGRYGDSLNPDGTRMACNELKRVLASGGNLYFALPIGNSRVCFNAHRIHDAKTIIEYFPGLDLVEYSGVHDDGRYVEKVDIDEFADSQYACGLFWFRKPQERGFIKHG